jgi:hypothetical protein
MYLLTAIGLSPGGSTHLHTNNTQNNANNDRTTQINNVEECGPCPVFASFYPGICLTIEEKARKNHSQGKNAWPPGSNSFMTFLSIIPCDNMCTANPVRRCNIRSNLECRSLYLATHILSVGGSCFSQARRETRLNGHYKWKAQRLLVPLSCKIYLLP